MLIDDQTLLAQLYTDSTFRSSYFEQHPNELPRNAIARYARSLVRKRYGEIADLLPATCRSLGDEALRLFTQHAAGFTPRGPQRHVHDAMAFARFLSSRVSVVDLRRETRWLEQRWHFHSDGVRPRIPFIERIRRAT